MVATTAGTQETEGGRAVDALVALTRSWLGPMSRDIPSLDATSFTERVNTPEDAVASARRLVALVKKVASEGKALPYQAELEKSMGDAIDAAVKESEQAQDALRGSQDLQAQTREAAAALQSELVAFRRALRGVTGTSHRDYLALRTERVQQSDPLDGTVPAPAPAPAVTIPANNNPSTQEVAPAK